MGGRGGRHEIVDRNVSGVGALGFFLVFGISGVFFFEKSKCGMVLGALVRGISFRFGTIGRAAFFDLGGFVVGKLGNFGGARFFGFAFGLVFLYFFDFLD